MIASLSGVVQSVGDGTLVMEVGGLGIRVLVPDRILDANVAVGRSTSLYTYMVVRQDSLTLFGFATEEQRSFFELLLGVSGVGPKLALAILSSLSTDSLRSSVLGDQPKIINRVSGVGKRTAEKIIFHLKDRLGATLPELGAGALSNLDEQLVEALTALGYSVVEAQSALESLPTETPGDIEARIRLALQYFSN